MNTELRNTMPIQEANNTFFDKLLSLMKEYDVEFCADSPHDARIDMQIYIRGIEYDFGSHGSIDTEDIQKKIIR